MPLDPALAALDHAYLTTTGRTSGEPRTIEIWFAAEGDHIYLLSGGGEGSHWVKNLQRQPSATVKIGDESFAVTARFPGDLAETTLIRDLLFAKYHTRTKTDLRSWQARSLPVALDITG